MSMPLLLLALFFAVCATVEWNRLPLIARMYLGAATAFAIGAMTHPGMTIVEAIETGDGIAALLVAARVAAFAAVMVSLATGLRRLALR